MKLSIPIIVKNEEKNLERTLRALEELRNKLKCEVIVVDTGSIDKTLEIAKKYTDNVYEHKWTGDFSEMRNLSLRYCTGEWILVLDADEVLENPEDIIAFLQSDISETVNSATVKIVNSSGSSEKVMNETSVVRMFKKSANVKYVGKIHEQPINIYPTVKTNIKFRHYGYSNDDYELMIYKFKRNTELLKEELKCADDNKKIYILFQLSKSYDMANKNEISLKYIEEAYELEKKISKKNNAVHTYVYYCYTCVLFNMGYYDRIVKIAKEITSIIHDNLDIYYMLAISYTNLEKYELAYGNYEKYFKIKAQRDKGIQQSDISLSESSNIRSEKVRANRLNCYYKQKRYSDIVREVKEHKEVLEFDNVVDMYICSCIWTNKFDEVYEFYKNKKLEDCTIQSLIANFLGINVKSGLEKVHQIKEVLSNLDDRFKIYIDVIDNNNIQDVDKIDFKDYFDWKKDILERVILKDINKIELIKDIDIDVVDDYMNNIVSNYECLKSIFSYCRKNMLVTDVSKSNFISNIEKSLLLYTSIAGKEYKHLVVRSLINRSILRNRIFNKSLLENNKIRCVLSKYDRFWLDIEENIKIYPSSKKEFLKGLNALTKENKEYVKIIKVFSKEIDDMPISEEMKSEKNLLLKEVEKYISNNELKQAELFLDELEKIFKWEKDIFNYRGVIDYINGKYEDALDNLSLALILMDNKFEPLYNIACVLESMNRIEDSVVYYKEAMEICSDENVKKQIIDILQKLNIML